MTMCTKEEVRMEIEKSETRMMNVINQRLADLEKKAQATIIDRNSVHDQLTYITKASDRILEQTTRTNGRVTTLETWREVQTAELKPLKDSVDGLKNTLTKLNWLVVSAVVLALLSLVLIN